MASQRLLFMNVGWMERYEGPRGDRIIGGGAHVRRTGWGHEAYNFKPYKGYVYGYVQPKAESIRLERLPGGRGQEHLDDVLVVWTATRPGVGPVVVGWYEHATVYRSRQAGLDHSRILGGEPCPYYAVARSKDCHRLPIDLRTFAVPRGGKGEMGESNVWFAAEQVGLKREVRSFITGVITGRVKVAIPRRRARRRSGGSFRQPDPARRKAVERAAVRCVTQHFRRLGYDVESREDESLGWDLEASRGEVVLKIEVKGWSAETGLSELTPNELRACRAHQDSYRICLVKNALARPIPLVFSYSNEVKQWVDDKGLQLSLDPIEAARISIRAVEEV